MSIFAVYIRQAALCILGLTWLGTAFAVEVSPQEVDKLIESKGTSYVRESYFSCWEPNKAAGYALVETGAADWLRIAVRLLRDSDGCYSLSLKTSIALAQLSNPKNVLELVDTGENLEAAHICVPFMEDEVDPKKMRAQIKLLDKLDSNLSKVKEKTLEGKKKKCLSVIRPLRKYINDQLRELNGSASK